MHFVLTIDVKVAGVSAGDINQKIIAALKPYSWVRPLGTTYILNVDGQLQWDTIFNSLVAIAEAHKGHLDFLMTPLMQGGRYNGMLSSGLWEEINKRSK